MQIRRRLHLCSNGSYANEVCFVGSSFLLGGIVTLQRMAFRWLPARLNDAGQFVLGELYSNEPLLKISTCCTEISRMVAGSTDGVGLVWSRINTMLP